MKNNNEDEEYSVDKLGIVLVFVSTVLVFTFLNLVEFSSF